MWFFGKIEPFVNDTQARADIITTFISISIVFFGMVIAFLLLWSYNKSDKLFFIVFSAMVALYSITMVIFIAIIRSNITSIQFKTFMITGIFMAILSIIILILFVVKSTSLFRNVNKYSPEPIEQSYRVPENPRRNNSEELQIERNDIDDIENQPHY